MKITINKKRTSFVSGLNGDLIKTMTRLKYQAGNYTVAKIHKTIEKCCTNVCIALCVCAATVRVLIILICVM